MYKPLDSRQILNRAILQELFPYIGGQTLDILMASINSDVTPPLKVDASNPASKIINIGPAIVANSQSNRNRSLSFIDNVIPTFTSGTVTFPASSGGNIVSSPGGSTVLTLPSNDYVQVLLSLDNSGNIHTTVGTPNAVLANAAVPAPVANQFPFAYVTVFNNTGTIQNISQSSIYQFVGNETGGFTTPSPTVQNFTSSGTYTTPTNPSPLYIRVYAVGGGAGGGGGGNTGGTLSAGTNGGSTVFGPGLIIAGGGSGGGTGASNGIPGAGGTASISAPAIGLAIAGSPGAGGGSYVNSGTASGIIAGPSGGNAPYFSGAGSNYAGGFINGTPNSGGGGPGGSAQVSSSTTQTGGGGGSGGFANAIIPSPASSYNVTIGVGGTGGGAGGGASAGSNGASGQIIVEEFY